MVQHSFVRVLQISNLWNGALSAILVINVEIGFISACPTNRGQFDHENYMKSMYPRSFHLLFTNRQFLVFFLNNFVQDNCSLLA